MLCKRVLIQYSFAQSYIFTSRFGGLLGSEECGGPIGFRGMRRSLGIIG